MSNVPATVFSYNTSNVSNVVAIGDTRVSPDRASEHRFFFVVVSLSDLSVAAQSVSTSNSDVPSDIQAYAGSTGHFLVFTCLGQITGNMPQGDLAAFLRAAGSGRVLEGMEQAVAQLGTGNNGSYTYALAATLDDGDLPGYEVGSFSDFCSYLTFAFMPMEGGGYAPVSL
ncbi:MAG: hypothetical protein AAGI52_08615 [Bacteroidota bacterium]